MNRIKFFTLCLLALTVTLSPQAFAQSVPRPNILIVFIDDMGYGDLSCFGSKTIKTPRIDALADQGTKYTSFYAQTVCGPSRSALLTGRYPVRSLGWSMPASEITIAEQLKTVGYTTGAVGKWDVSNRKPIIDRMPIAQGFDSYWGTLGANDGGKVTFHENNTQLNRTDDMASLTRQYTDKGIEFLKQNKDKPFFLYLCHTMVHSVIDATPQFKGKSAAGLYGDCVEEIDFHTGRLLDTLDDLGLRKNTLVIFTSDNGPWSNFQESLGPKHNGAIAWGSSGPLRGAKGSSYEGGDRVPCIVRWPGVVPVGQTSDAIFSTLDFMPTFANLTGYAVPDDRPIDGIDQTQLLYGRSAKGARDNFYYYVQGELHAIRKNNWKVILPNHQKIYKYVKDRGSNGVELYNLNQDIGESKNLADANPKIVKRLSALANTAPRADNASQNFGISAPQPKAK